MDNPVYITIPNVNEGPVVQGNLVGQVEHVSPPNDVEDPQFGYFMPNPLEENMMTHSGAHMDTEFAYIYLVLEEQLRLVGGFNVYGLDALDMRLVPNVAIPPKFKVLNFEKYNGLNYPRRYLWIVLYEDGCLRLQ